MKNVVWLGAKQLMMNLCGRAGAIQILERVLATTTIWIDHVERSNNAELAKRSTERTK